MKLLVQPYKISSVGAKVLAELLGVKRVNVAKNTFNPTAVVNVINWGSSKEYGNVKYLNKPQAVAVASDKLATFKTLKDHGVKTVEWTDDFNVAKSWVSAGEKVFARTLLSASQGRGIVVCTNADNLVECSLYTKYKKKASEFRVHVFDNEVILVQEKRMKSGQTEKPNAEIRSHANGWVFCKQNVVCSDALASLAKKAVKGLGLDFGAVDVIYNKLENTYYVLEVNTAPGLEGTTVNDYVAAIKRKLEQNNSLNETIGNNPTLTANPH